MCGEQIAQFSTSKASKFDPGYASSSAHHQPQEIIKCSLIMHKVCANYEKVIGRPHCATLVDALSRVRN